MGCDSPAPSPPPLQRGTSAARGPPAADQGAGRGAPAGAVRRVLEPAGPRRRRRGGRGIVCEAARGSEAKVRLCHCPGRGQFPISSVPSVWRFWRPWVLSCLGWTLLSGRSEGLTANTGCCGSMCQRSLWGRDQGLRLLQKHERSRGDRGLGKWHWVGSLPSSRMDERHSSSDSALCIWHSDRWSPGSPSPGCGRRGWAGER